MIYKSLEGEENKESQIISRLKKILEKKFQQGGNLGEILQSMV